MRTKASTWKKLVIKKHMATELLQLKTNDLPTWNRVTKTQPLPWERSLLIVKAYSSNFMTFLSKCYNNVWWFCGFYEVHSIWYMIVQISPYSIAKKFENNFPISTHIWSCKILAIIQRAGLKYSTDCSKLLLLQIIYFAKNEALCWHNHVNLPCK